MSSFRNIVIYGAGGQNIGQAVLEALLEEGSFSVTVLARKSSKSNYPTSVRVAKVEDDLPHAELVSALKGQDVVVSTVGTFGIESQTKVIDAAVEAGVKRFVPSEWGFDNADPAALALSPIFRPKGVIQKYLEAKVKANPGFSWHSVANSIWLEWGLEIGFLDILPFEHSVRYWDNGTYRTSLTTVSYASKALAESLKHPEETKNKRIYASAATASQREIVAELEKQQGVKYTVKTPVDGKQEIKQAQDQWEASKHTDWDAAFRTVAASVLMEEYGANFEETKKGSLVVEFAQMSKLTLEDIVKDLIARHSSK